MIDRGNRAGHPVLIAKVDVFLGPGFLELGIPSKDNVGYL